MGISSNVDGKDIKLYSKEEIKDAGEMEFNRAHMYIFYPIKKQMSIAMGEHKFCRTGLEKENETP